MFKMWLVEMTDESDDLLQFFTCRNPPLFLVDSVNKKFTSVNLNFARYLMLAKSVMKSCMEVDSSVGPDVENIEIGVWTKNQITRCFLI